MRIGQSTHKARPLATTDFMEDVRRQMRTGYLTREMALEARNHVNEAVAKLRFDSEPVRALVGGG